MKIVRSPKPKHKGVLFLLDEESGVYIGKVYDVPEQEEVARAFSRAYEELITGNDTDCSSNEFIRSLGEREIMELYGGLD